MAATQEITLQVAQCLTCGFTASGLRPLTVWSAIVDHIQYLHPSPTASAAAGRADEHVSGSDPTAAALSSNKESEQ